MVDPHYRYWTVWSDDDGEWVGLCNGFPLLSWLEPDRAAAEAGIRALVAEVVGDLKARDRPLPPADVQWPPRKVPSAREAETART